MSSDLLRAILVDREGSWAVVGLLALIASLLIRSLLLKSISHAMKVRDVNWYRRMLFYYQKKCIWGWICFFVAVAGITLFWRFESLFLKYLNGFEWLLFLIIFYTLSLFLHAHAYASAIVETVSENISGDKDL